MQINNQKPVVLSPVYSSRITGDFEPENFIKEAMAKPMFTPMVQNTPVTITHDKNNITEDDIVETIISCCQDTFDKTAEDFMKELFANALVYYDKNTPVTLQNVFMAQSIAKSKLPYPTSTVIYTAKDDVIPTAKEFIAGICDSDKFFASLAAFARVDVLGYHFINEQSFENFKTWLNQQTTMLANVLPVDTKNLLTEFQKLKLNQLTESLIIRNDSNENNDEYSFARTLVTYLNTYVNSIDPQNSGILPFNTGEVFCPTKVVFVNVEKHAHARPKQVTDEWQMIRKSSQLPIKVANNKKLAKMTATARSLQRASGAAAATQQAAGAARSANIRFRKKPPTTKDLVKLMNNVLKSMQNVAFSQNSYTNKKASYNKPNRRNPDDYNKPGVITSRKYRPDIHIYADTSGSISEENYQNTVMAMIKMAKKLDVDIYINTFSDFMTQATRLSCKGRSVKQIYAQVQKMPKAYGGTDFEQIWHYINASTKRKKEASFIITDFEWYPPNKHIEHPKNLYYLPIAETNYSYLTQSAKEFCERMIPIEANIRKHVLF